MKQWLGIVGGVLLATTASAGTVVHFATKSGADAQKDHEVYYAQGGMLRVDELDNDGHVQEMTLVRDGTIWRVNIPQRTFIKFDNTAVQAQMGGMDERMKARLASLPPDTRAMFEQRFQAAKSGAPIFEFKDTGKTDRSGAYSCEVWTASKAGRLFAEHCLVTASGLTGGAELEDALRKAIPVVKAAVTGTMFAATAEIYEQFEKAGGFPVRTRHMSGSDVSSEDFVTSVETLSLPADKFAIPKGFTQTTMGH